MRVSFYCGLVVAALASETLAIQLNIFEAAAADMSGVFEASNVAAQTENETDLEAD